MTVLKLFISTLQALVTKLVQGLSDVYLHPIVQAYLSYWLREAELLNVYISVK